MVWMIIGLLVALMVVIALINGLAKMDALEIGFDLVTGSTSTFEIGVSNHHYTMDDGGHEQELRIGLLLITIIIVFIRFDA